MTKYGLRENTDPVGGSRGYPMFSQPITIKKKASPLFATAATTVIGSDSNVASQLSSQKKHRRQNPPTATTVPMTSPNLFTSPIPAALANERAIKESYYAATKFPTPQPPRGILASAAAVPATRTSAIRPPFGDRSNNTVLPPCLTTSRPSAPILSFAALANGASPSWTGQEEQQQGNGFVFGDSSSNVKLPPPAPPTDRFPAGKNPFALTPDPRAKRRSSSARRSVRGRRSAQKGNVAQTSSQSPGKVPSTGQKNLEKNVWRLEQRLGRVEKENTQLGLMVNAQRKTLTGYQSREVNASAIIGRLEGRMFRETATIEGQNALVSVLEARIARQETRIARQDTLVDSLIAKKQEVEKRNKEVSLPAANSTKVPQKKQLKKQPQQLRRSGRLAQRT